MASDLSIGFTFVFVQCHLLRLGLYLELLWSSWKLSSTAEALTIPSRFAIWMSDSPARGTWTSPMEEPLFLPQHPPTNSAALWGTIRNSGLGFPPPRPQEPISWGEHANFALSSLRIWEQLLLSCQHQDSKTQTHTWYTQFLPGTRHPLQPWDAGKARPRCIPLLCTGRRLRGCGDPASFVGWSEGQPPPW